MGDVVDLRGHSMSLDDDIGVKLVEDLSRYAEGLLSEAAIKKRYRFSDADWENFGSNDELVRRVEATKLHRIRTGATKRERAQLEIIDGPPILGKIMRDPNANERHRIDSIKALDALATDGPAAAATAGDRFIIQINLGSDTEIYNKSIKVDPNDRDPNDHDPDDTAPQGFFAMAAANKPKDGGGEQGHL